MKLTSELRNGADQLWLSYQKPHSPASKDTVSRWIKEFLKISGIDISSYGAHSTRAASSPAASSSLTISHQTIMNAAGWARESTFRKFYDKQADSESPNFGEQLLLQRRSHVPARHKLCWSVILQPTLFIRIGVWQFTSECSSFARSISRDSVAPDQWLRIPIKLHLTGKPHLISNYGSCFLCRRSQVIFFLLNIKTVSAAWGPPFVSIQSSVKFGWNTFSCEYRVNESWRRGCLYINHPDSGFNSRLWFLFLDGASGWTIYPSATRNWSDVMMELFHC